MSTEQQSWSAWLGEGVGGATRYAFDLGVEVVSDFGSGFIDGVTLSDDAQEAVASSLASDQLAGEAAALVAATAPTGSAGAPWFGDSNIEALLSDALGVPYWWGAGGLICPWPVGGPGGGANAPYGYDCSGFALNALFLILGLLHPASPIGRTAADMSEYCDRLEVGEQRAGDLAFYNAGSGVCHVVVVVGPPESDKHSQCFGASGSGSGTKGQKPEECVKKHKSNYWSAFSHFGRIPDNKDTRTAIALHKFLMIGLSGQKLSTVYAGKVDASKLASADAALAKIVAYFYPKGL